MLVIMMVYWTFLGMLILIRIECDAIMYEPTFVSEWYPLAAGTNETLKIYHNLGEYPVKVELQVKINESGKDYIFSGIGSSQRDDDYSNHPVGGVVYKYNTDYVQIGVPFRSNTQGTSPKGLTYTGHRNSIGYTLQTFLSSVTNGLHEKTNTTKWNNYLNDSDKLISIISMITAGSDGLYYGPTYVCGPYLTGHVRARMWLEIDMPAKVFTSSVYMSNNEDECYQEIVHNLGYYPDMVTVQTRLGTTRFMADGIGAMFVSNTSNKANSLGGVLFGYDDTKIRIWVPSKFGNESFKRAGGVFAASDGYILGTYADGVVNVAAWKIDCSQQVFHKTFSVGDGVIHDSVLEFPCAINLHNYLVSVQIKIPDGDGLNGGMLFYGVGTTQALPYNSIKFGGIVYGHTDKEVLFWRPNNKPVFIVEDRWGHGNSSQNSMVADILIRVFHLPESECPNAETVGNSTYDVTGTSYSDTIQYECNPGYRHRGGNLIRTCGRDRMWSGIPPVCTIINCPVPESVQNGNYISSSGSGSLYLPGYTVTYICFSYHILIGGQTIRTCQSSELWTGTPPVCSAIGCPIPDLVDNASNTTSTVLLNTSLYSVGTTITYVCEAGYTTTIGSSSRKCESNGYWDGLPPVCTIMECPTLDFPGNGSYTPTTSVYLPYSMITYQCDPGFTLSGGSVSRTCNNSGSWDGIPAFCTVISCPAPDPIVNGSYSPTSDVYLPGVQITYDCNQDLFITSGSISRTCGSSGSWDGILATCSAMGCPIPDYVDNVSNTTSTSLLSTSLYPVGTTITYVCDTGYSLAYGHTSRTCQSSGHWNRIPPACTIIECPMPDFPGNGSYRPTTSVYLPYSMITYQCNPGFTLSGGSVSRTCNNSGSWDGVPAFCTVIKCPVPDFPGNGSYTPTTSVYLPYSMITYQCNPGFTLSGGSVSRTCKNSGSWDGVPAFCTVISCPEPDPVMNGSYSPTSDVYLPGVQITYDCNQDLSITSGSISRTCESSGSWDGIPATCSAIGCPIPDNIDNASNTTSTSLLSTSLYPVGTIITYVCDTGYSLAYGHTSRACQSSGYWNRIPPACTTITCHPPDPVGNGSYTPIAGTYSPGSVITYNCNPGFGITGGSVSRTCGSSGSWDGFPAACTACAASTAGSGNGGVEDIDNLIQTMRVDKKHTSSYVRSLNSAYDGRQSAEILGYGGVVLIVVVCCCFILPDIFRVMNHFKPDKK